MESRVFPRGKLFLCWYESEYLQNCVHTKMKANLRKFYNKKTLREVQRSIHIFQVRMSLKNLHSYLKFQEKYVENGKNGILLYKYIYFKNIQKLENKHTVQDKYFILASI